MFKCERCREEFDYNPYEIYGDCFCSECALENLVEEVREPSMCRKFLCWIAKTRMTDNKYNFIDDIALSTDEEVVSWVEEDATVDELMDFFTEEM